MVINFKLDLLYWVFGLMIVRFSNQNAIGS